MVTDFDFDWGISKTTIILIGGKAGVGKTTVANMFMNLIPSEYRELSTIKPFASGVKVVARLMGWDGIKDNKGRLLLQNIGNVGRIYDADTWVNFAMDTIADTFIVPPTFIFVDDWRFPNESIYFLNRPIEYNIVTIRVEAPNREILRGTPYYEDISEVSLPPGDSNYYNIVINNEGSMDSLRAQVEDLVGSVLLNRTFYGGILK